jgi:hypothetical protein
MSIRSALVTAGALAIALPGRARAGTFDAPDRAGPIPDAVTRAEVGPAVVSGWLESGPIADFLFGVDVNGGLRRDRWVAIARGGIAVLAPPGRHVPIGGDLIRFGGDVRYSLDQDRVLQTTKHGRPIAWLRGDLWLGAGLGYQVIGRRSGDGDHRADADLELGYSFLDHGDGDDDRYTVLTFALALVVAHAPPAPAPAPPPGLDHSWLITVSYTFGR